MNNQQPTEAALECAKQLRFRIGPGPRTIEDEARLIDQYCDLPRLTVIAMCAQGVVDAWDRPLTYPGSMVGPPIETLRDAIAKKNP